MNQCSSSSSSSSLSSPFPSAHAAEFTLYLLLKSEFPALADCTAHLGPPSLLAITAAASCRKSCDGAANVTLPTGQSETVLSLYKRPTKNSSPAHFHLCLRGTAEKDSSRQQPVLSKWLRLCSPGIKKEKKKPLIWIQVVSRPNHCNARNNGVSLASGASTGSFLLQFLSSYFHSYF